MDASIKKVLVWKERPQLWAISLGLIGVALIVFVSTLILQSNASPELMAGQFFGITMAFGCVAALAMGSLLFAPEREAGTDQWMSSLPLSGRQVARAKLVESTKFFFLTWLAMGLLGLALYYFGYGKFNVELDNVGIEIKIARLLTFLCIPIQCFLWSLLASIRFEKSITAIVVAAILSVAGVILASMWFDVLGIQVSNKQSWFYSAAGYLVLIAVQWILILQWSSHWLRDSSKMPTWSSLLSAVGSRLDSVRTGSRSKIIASRPSHPFRVLMWETWRTRKWYLIGALLICFGLSVVGMLIPITLVYNSPSPSDSEGFRYIIFFCAVLLGLVAGLSTFGADQTQKQYRFFQHYADYPRHLWLVRMSLIAIVGTMFFSALCIVLFNLAQSSIIGQRFDDNLRYARGYYGPSESIVDPRFTLWRPMFLFVATAGISQLFSIFFRSGILMFLFATGACVLSAWPLSYIAWLGEPMWIFGWPLVIALYLASFFYSSYWLREQRLWTSAAITSVVAIGICAATIIGLREHRLNEFQPVAMFDDLQEWYGNQDAELQSNKKKYGAALALNAALKSLKPVEENEKTIFPDSEENNHAFVEMNRSAIDQVIESLKDENARYALNAYSRVIENSQIDTIEQLLKIEFEDQIRVGNLDKALDAAVASFNELNLKTDRLFDTKWTGNLIRWAEAEGQSSEKIKQGMTELSQAVENFCDPNSPKLIERVFLNALRKREDWKRGSRNIGRIASNSTFLQPQTARSWESERSIRLLQHTLEAHSKVRSTSWKQFCSTCLSRTANYRENPYYATGSDWATNQTMDELRKKIDHTTIHFETWSDPQTTHVATAIRYVLVRMALAAYRADNDRYPERLADLVPNYLDSLPVGTDGRQFAYSAMGVDLPVAISIGFYEFNPFQTSRPELLRCENYVPAGRPFLLPYSGVPQLKRDFVYHRDDVVAIDSQDRSDTEEVLDQQTGYWLSGIRLFDLPPKDKPGQHFILGEFAENE